MKNAIAYERVSTAGQGKSGLGLDAQREAIDRFSDTLKCVQPEHYRMLTYLIP
jgi:DNA invertase Pin-like site-specific DNA recombinase